MNPACTFTICICALSTIRDHLELDEKSELVNVRHVWHWQLSCHMLDGSLQPPQVHMVAPGKFLQHECTSYSIWKERGCKTSHDFTRG